MVIRSYMSVPFTSWSYIGALTYKNIETYTKISFLIQYSVVYRLRIYLSRRCLQRKANCGISLISVQEIACSLGHRHVIIKPLAQIAWIFICVFNAVIRNGGKLSEWLHNKWFRVIKRTVSTREVVGWNLK